jgi:hypothetical protein
MSAAFTNVAKIQVKWGYATLDTIQGWQDRKFLTAAEADQVRTYWHELNDPPADPEPDDPTSDTQPVTSP